MPDRIDLDDLDVTEESDDEDRPNRGDWFWGDDGTESAADADGGSVGDADGRRDASAPDRPDAGAGAGPAEAVDPADEPAPEEHVADVGADVETSAPRVPYADDDKPVGIPVEGGGAGGVSSDARDRETHGQPEASGPHGSGADETTMAFSYRALRGLDDVHAALADANRWTDWLGVVGDVDAHVLNKFQRDEGLDFDFFNGTGTGPGERLAEVDGTSMFYAERMVLVGVESAGERGWAETADWEFVPLPEAADAADWRLAAEEDGGDGGDETNTDEVDGADDADDGAPSA